MSHLLRIKQEARKAGERIKENLIVLNNANTRREDIQVEQKRKIAWTNCKMPLKAGFKEVICKADLPPQCLTVEDYVTWHIQEDEQYFRRRKYVQVELLSNEDYAHLLRSHIEKQGGIEDENCILYDDWLDAQERAKKNKLYQANGELYTPQDYLNLKDRHQ